MGVAIMSLPPFSDELHYLFHAKDGGLVLSGSDVTGWDSIHGLTPTSMVATQEETSTENPQLTTVNGFNAVLFNRAATHPLRSTFAQFNENGATVFAMWIPNISGIQQPVGFGSWINGTFGKWTVNDLYFRTTSERKTTAISSVGVPVVGGLSALYSPNEGERVRRLYFNEVEYPGVILQTDTWNENSIGSPWAGRPYGNYSQFNGIVCSILFYNRNLTDQEMLQVSDWWYKEYGYRSASPHPGIHEVQDLAHADDPNNIYFGQGVQIGDTFSFKETTETNGWGVGIDALGYPIIDPAGGSGTDSFLFNIDKGSGWEPEPPASYTWNFTISPPGPSPDPSEGGPLSLDLTLRL